MATVIVFNSKGRAFWKSVKSGENLVHKINEYQSHDTPYSQEDKDWFRKPLGK